jgi:hypothetical protein
MGYLINTEFISTKIVIPEADVQVLDSTPYTILNYSGSGFIQTLTCAVTPDINQTTPYTGFDHLYLRTQPTASIRLGVYDELTYQLETNYLSCLIINMQHPPNRFGVAQKAFTGLALEFGLPISGGDGDLIVFLQYRIINL